MTRCIASVSFTVSGRRRASLKASASLDVVLEIAAWTRAIVARERVMATVDGGESTPQLMPPHVDESVEPGIPTNACRCAVLKLGSEN
jgi:hypothetical protein